MSVVDDLKQQISDKRITFDPPPAEAARLQEELLGANEGKKVTERLQSLVLAVSKLEKIQINSIIRNEGRHGTGRAFDVGNESIAASLLPSIATSDRVKELGIDEIIFDAGGATLAERNKWNFDAGEKALVRRQDAFAIDELAPGREPRCAAHHPARLGRGRQAAVH